MCAVYMHSRSFPGPMASTCCAVQCLHLCACRQEPESTRYIEDLDKQTSHFPNAKGRTFHTLAEAQRFMLAHAEFHQAVGAKIQPVITHQGYRVRYDRSVQ
jgi:hypothetical protein